MSEKNIEIPKQAKRIASASVAIMVGAVLLLGSFWFYQISVDDKRAKLEDQIVALRSGETNLQEQVGGLEVEKGALEKEKNSLEQLRETLERQIRGLGESEKEAVAEAPTGNELANCFSDHALSFNVDPVDWSPVRNYHTGYQVMRAPELRLDRVIELEKPGVEVFRISSDAYGEGALLSAYNMNQERYSVSLGESEELRYEMLSDTWHKISLGESGAQVPQECAAQAKTKTRDQNLPIYLLDKADGSRAYLVLGGFAQQVGEPRDPVLLEFSVGIVDAADLAQTDFITELEALVQSTFLFNPGAPLQIL